jgi:hypothetical protein
MRSKISSALLIGSLMLGATVAGTFAAVPSAKRPAAVESCFQGDPRLLTSLDVAEKDRPLADWLKTLSAQLGLPLTATRYVADEKLTAFLSHRPAGEVLTLVARHLELEWIKGKSGYLLAEPLDVRPRRTWQQEEWLVLQDWMARLARLNDTPEEQLQARRSEVNAALQNAALAPERRQALAEECDLLEDRFRHSRAVPVAVRLYQSLTPTQLELLRSTGFLRLSSNFGSLSPEIVKTTHQVLGDSGRPEMDGTVPQAEFTLTLTERARDSARPNGARQLKLDVELTAVIEDRSTSMLNWRPRAPAAELPAAAAGEVDPVLQQPQEFKLTPEQPARSVAEAGITAYTLNQWPDSIRLASVAEALHRLTGRDVIADSFIRARLNPALLAKQRNAAEVLATMAKELDYTWRQNGKTVFLESRSREYDRAAEVPERVLQPFRKRALSVPVLGLDDFAGLATTLTDSQCRGLNDFWGYYLEGTGVAPLWTSGGLYDARHGLRLWASLSRAQRRHALAEILTTEDMNPAQRRACALAISAPGDELGRPDGYKIPTPENLSGRIGGFRVRPRQAEAQAYQDDQGNYTASIETVGSDRGFLGGFGRFGPPPKALGPKTPLEVFDFIYYVGDGQLPPTMVRSSNLHLVPRWQKP